MKEGQYPHSVPGWLNYITQFGVSNRPFAEDGTDLLDSDNYPDLLDTKPERAALAAILAVRGYQRAKKYVREERKFPAKIPSFLIAHIPIPKTQRIGLLALKSAFIGSAFTSAMQKGLIEDETHLQSLPPDLPAPSVYHRMEDILSPHRDAIFGYARAKAMGRQINEDQSLVLLDVYGGVGALPTNIELLLQSTIGTHYAIFREWPTVRTILRRARNSFDTFILPMASMHKADGRHLMNMINAGYGIADLHEDGIRVLPEILQNMRGAERVNRSRTARCSFLANPKDFEKFLDEPVDFENPLRDAFDLHMDLLAA